MKFLTAIFVVITLIVIGSMATTATAESLPRNTTYDRLIKQADNEIRNGGIYSHRWGDASPRLRYLCYKIVELAFKPYGTQEWAHHVVNRESGCNPGAINSSSGTTGIAQIHPRYHKWINYNRVQRDMRYALSTFIRLSRGGHSTRPWCLCR